MYIKALWNTNNQWKRIPYGYFMVALVKKCFAPLLQRSKYRECTEEEATFSMITFILTPRPNSTFSRVLMADAFEHSFYSLLF